MMRRSFEDARWCALGLLLLWAFLSALIAKTANGASQSSEAIELAFLNGRYTDLDAGLRPVEQGPLTIRLSSPEHHLTVHRNHMTFDPAGSGVYAATVEVDLEGGGKLFADVEGIGLSSRFEDDVEAPRQTWNVAGKVRLERAEGGYEVTLVETPSATPIEIRSGVISQVVALCTTFDALPLVALDCPAVENALTRQQVPMPEAGERFFLARDRLSEDEQAVFDRLSR